MGKILYRKPPFFLKNKFLITKCNYKCIHICSIHLYQRTTFSANILKVAFIQEVLMHLSFPHIIFLSLNFEILKIQNSSSGKIIRFVCFGKWHMHQHILNKNHLYIQDQGDIRSLPSKNNSALQQNKICWIMLVLHCILPSFNNWYFKYVLVPFLLRVHTYNDFFLQKSYLNYDKLMRCHKVFFRKLQSNVGTKIC